jgi:hypothetical protein
MTHVIFPFVKKEYFEKWSTHDFSVAKRELTIECIRKSLILRRHTKPFKILPGDK